MDELCSYTSGLVPANGMNVIQQSTFHSFQHLPAELRQKIWRAASPKPCCILCAQHESIRYESPEETATFRAVIQTCREARSQFIYTTTEPPIQANKSHPMYRVSRFHPSFSKVFFSFEIDSLNFMFARYLDMLKPNSQLLPEDYGDSDDCKYIKYLSVGLDEFLHPTGSSSSSSNEGEPWTGFESLPKFFPSLETISLLTSDAPHSTPGETSAGGFAEMWISVEKHRTQKQMVEAKEQFELMKQTRPEWRPPLLEFRGYQEFLASPHDCLMETFY